MEIIKNLNGIDRELYIFDLDGTLTVSKSPATPKMASLILELAKKRKVAVISGGEIKQFQKQLINHLPEDNTVLSNIFLFPTCGACFYRYDNGWQKVYSHDLSSDEKKKIIQIFNDVVMPSPLIPKETYGEKIEDRGTQITISALGQDAPIEIKSTWDPDQQKRFGFKKLLDPLLPEFEVKVGGTTSIDVTKKGIDKAYGVKEMEKHLQIPINKMIFVGDALYPGGNDHAALKSGVEAVAVKDEKDTEIFIKNSLAILD